jgi:hypothetical protein
VGDLRKPAPLSACRNQRSKLGTVTVFAKFWQVVRSERCSGSNVHRLSATDYDGTLAHDGVVEEATRRLPSGGPAEACPGQPGENPRTLRWRILQSDIFNPSCRRLPLLRRSKVLPGAFPHDKKAPRVFGLDREAG